MKEEKSPSMGELQKKYPNQTKTICRTDRPAKVVIFMTAGIKKVNPKNYINFRF